MTACTALRKKLYELEGRFPAYPEEVPDAAVDYLAGLVKVEPEAFGSRRRPRARSRSPRS